MVSLVQRAKQFPLGKIVATPSVVETIAADELIAALSKHARGVWGDVDPADAQANDEAVKLGLRLLSAYKTGAGSTFWIITEADRSVTTILFPSEY